MPLASKAVMLAVFVVAGSLPPGVAATSPVPVGAPLAEVFTNEMTGISQTCYTGIEAPDGSLYFGADVLARFDGATWTTRQVGRTTAIQAIDIAPDGRMWVGGVGELGYFPRHGPDPGEFVSLRDQLPPEVGDLAYVWNIFARDGSTVIVTNDHVLIWADGAFTVHHVVHDYRRLIAHRVGGRILVVAGRQGSYEVVGLRLVPWGGPDAGDLRGAMWIEQSDQGTRTVSNQGLTLRSRGETVSLSNEIQQVTEPGIVAAVARLDPRVLVAATLNRGIVAFDNDGRILRVLDDAAGLPARFTNHLFLDRHRTLWVCAGSSILRLTSPLTASRFDEAHGFGTEPVHVVGSNSDGVLVASDRGLFTLAPPTPGDDQPAGARPLVDEMVLDFVVTGEVALVCTMSGVHEISGGAARQVYYQPREVNAIVPSGRGPGRYVASGSHVLTFQRQADGGYEVTRGPALPTFARSIVEDEEGNIWIGSSAAGLLAVPTGFAGDRAVPVVLDPTRAAGDGEVLATLAGRSVVVLAGSGVYHRRAGTAAFERLPGFDGLVPVAVSKPSPDRVAWLAFVRHIAGAGAVPVIGRLAADANGALAVTWFDLPELAHGGAVRSLHAEQRGGEAHLWVGGTRGLLQIGLAGVAPAAPPQPPLLTAGFDAAHSRPGAAGEPVLPFTSNRLSFSYSTTDYARRHALAFQTRLVGLDDDWSAAGTDPTREFPFLDDGAYRFEVRAVSAAGLASTPATWAFRILPPWWRSGWAFASYTVLAGVLLYGADRLRIRRMRDRTRWLEEQVRARTAELEKANEAKTEFVARVNHDIRNPINGVLGLTLALEQSPLNEDQRRMAGTIRQCAKFLASLVEEVLDFAEIESGAIRLRNEPFAVREAVGAALATIEPLAAEAGCRLESRVDPAIPERLTGDSARLQQILVNFLSNAVKFGAGQPVLLRVDALHEMAGRLVLRAGVRDHGPGLDPGEQQRLFRKFARGRQAQERKIKGTGLGLAVCHLLAERMGGRVGVESTAGAGAEFFLEVPFEVGAAGAADAAPSVVATNARVLVVEDEDYNAIALTAMLERMGFRVDRCGDGVAALELLGRHRYDVVFLDWELPKLNGIEVARRFRQLESGERHTLIIATTAYASSDKRQACRDAGMDEFVAKPLTPDRITLAIRGHTSLFSPTSSILVREAPGGPAAGLDLSLFAYLSDGGTEALPATIEKFITDCEGELDEMMRLAAAADAAELRRTAHRFLSQCRFVGANRLAGLALELERESHDPAGAPVLRLLQSLRAEFVAFSSELRSALGGPAAEAPGPPRSQTG